MNKELSNEKQKLAYDVMEKFIQEYADRSLKEGEEIIAFEVKAFIANIDEGSISKAGFSIGAINLAEAKFNYESAITRYTKMLADAEAEEGGKQK